MAENIMTLLPIVIGISMFLAGFPYWRTFKGKLFVIIGLLLIAAPIVKNADITREDVKREIGL